MHSCFTSCIFAARTLDFAVKFRLVFRYETVVFRRCVLALLPVGLLRKFEAYLVYLSLIWTKNPRRFSFFKNSAISLICCYGFTLSSPVFPRELMTCAVVFQLCPVWPVPYACAQLSIVATARVIWLCPCVRYWPADRGLVLKGVTCFYWCYIYECRFHVVDRLKAIDTTC